MVDVAVLPAQDTDVVKVRAAELLRLPHVRSVAVRSDSSKALEWVAGDPNLEITYKEAGLAFRLDLARRLSRLSKSQGSCFERQRVCEQVQEGERVLVLGAGFGLTPCLLARHTPCAEVVAVERDAVAHEYAIKNAEANRVCLKVQNFNREHLDLDGLGDFDRVCAFLSFWNGDELQPLAANMRPPVAVLRSGGTLHCYNMETQQDFLNGPGVAEAAMREACGNRGFELMWRGKVPHKSIARSTFRMGYDFRLA